MARAQKSRSHSPSAKPRSKSRAQRNNRAKLKPQDVKLELQVVHPRAAGIDVGNEEHWVAVPPELDPQHPVRSFGCFTRDLREMADWLVGLRIDTVALQSTGVYWIGLHDILALGVSLVVHHNHAVSSVQNLIRSLALDLESTSHWA